MYRKNREEVPYHSGSAQQHEEWKDVMECIYQFTGDEDLVDQGVNSKAHLKQRDKDMAAAAAGEMIRSKNLNQFKKKAHQNLCDRAEKGKRPAHSLWTNCVLECLHFLKAKLLRKLKSSSPLKSTNYPALEMKLKMF